MNFNTPLPIPADAIPLTESEKLILRKYMNRKEAADMQGAAAMESLQDVGMSIARRAGHEAQSFKLSADLGCLIPVKE